jgi:hypothetical protein
MLDRPFLEFSRVLLFWDLLHLLPPKSNVNCTSPLEDYLSWELHFQFPKEFTFKSVTPLDRLLTIDARIPINIAKAPNLQSLDLLLG